MIELYCFGESGNAYKAALPLALAGLAWRPVHVDFSRGGARTPEYRAINPMGEVPALVDGDTVITQSGAIQDWIGARTGRFRGETEAERREVLRWVLWDNSKMSGLAGPRRFLMNFAPEAKRPAQVIDWLGGRLSASLSVLDAHLADRDWIVGEGPTNADLSCCGYLFYPEPFGFDRAAHPAIDAWLDRIAGLPGWRHPYDLMERALPDQAADRRLGPPDQRQTTRFR
jgi:glutathione S-transferase